MCVRVCVFEPHRPGKMRRLLLLLLGLLLLHQGRCFEFVIDGEWEDETVSWRVFTGTGVKISENLCLWLFFNQLYRLILKYQSEDQIEK